MGAIYLHCVAFWGTYVQSKCDFLLIFYHILLSLKIDGKKIPIFFIFIVYKLIYTDHQTKYQVPVLLYSRTNKLVLLYSRTHLQHVHNTRVVTASHWACGTGCRALLMMMVV